VDEVIDWAAMDYRLLRDDKTVAMLTVIAAESVEAGKRSADFWDTERRWRAGETAQIVRESLGRVKVEGMPS